MDQSKALCKLTEAIDLMQMVESLLDPGVLEHLSSTTLAGVRITLRNVREQVLASHDTLAENYVSRSRAMADARGSQDNRPMAETRIIVDQQPQPEAPPITRYISGNGGGAPSEMKRRDLRAAIEKVAAMEHQ